MLGKFVVQHRQMYWVMWLPLLVSRMCKPSLTRPSGWWPSCACYSSPLLCPLRIFRAIWMCRASGLMEARHLLGHLR